MSDRRDFLPDGRLAEVVRGEDVPNAQDIQDMAAELLRLRKQSRTDSRRSLQVRRLRWMVEHMIIKAETLADRARGIDGHRPHDGAMVAAIGHMADKLDALYREVKKLPLELEEVSVADLIAKWLRTAKTDTKILPDLKGTELEDLAADIERGAWREVLRG